MKKIPLSLELAELLGAHMGDGTLYKTKYSMVWEIRGDIEEKEYYIGNICPLIKSVFGIEIKSKLRNSGKCNVWVIQLSKREIINELLEYEMILGKKTHSAFIPKYIFNAEDEIKQAFIRGLFDTDGCLRFDKNKKKGLNKYPKLEFGFASIILRDSLKELLDELSFSSYIWTDKATTAYKLCLAGIPKLERWMVEIQPKNPKHLNKYEIWKRLGYYNAEVAQSGTAQIIV